jgi:hypothetical protein
MMIVPAVTVSPLKRFTPSRCEFESRPLRDDAAPFFFDMVPPQLFEIAVISIVE